MSDDLIKKSDAIRVIEKNEYRLKGSGLTYQILLKQIDEIPSADRPQGEWIDRSDGGRILHPWWESCECSQCKEWGSGAWNFCPHCGSRNREENE